MAAPMMNCVGFLRGHCKNYLPLRILCNNLYCTDVTESEDPVVISKTVEKIRDCSGLPQKWKKQHHGESPKAKSIMKLQKLDNRPKLRRLYAVYGEKSGIDPKIMYPSKAELEDLKEIERDWTPTFNQLKENLENMKAAEAEEARLKDERIEKAMGKMDQMIAQYKEGEKKKQATEQVQEEKMHEYLEEFRERYGFSVTVNSGKFKIFKRLKMEESRDAKKQQKKDSKKELSLKNLENLMKIEKK